MKPFVHIIALPCFLLSFACCQENEEPKILKGPSDEFHGSVGKGLPNVDLPEWVAREAGKVKLYADFENRSNTPIGITLYLVNDSGRKQSFSSHDHDIYLFLEYQETSGAWQRAQVYRNSFCGNSYYPVSLGPGEHFRFCGYLPREGKAVKVRYRSKDNSLMSQISDGFILEEDVRAAKFDDRAFQDIPYPIGQVFGHLA